MTTRWAAISRLGAVIAAVAMAGACAWQAVPIPDVTDKPLGEAITELEEAGFEPVVFGGHEVADVVDWTVHSHSPRNEERQRGEQVRLHVHSPLEAASATCGAGRVGDDGRSLILDMVGEDWGSGDLTLDEVMCVLEELDVSDAVLDKMGSTRSLDGRQEDDWDDIEASWSYHPDRGLDIVLEVP